MEKNEIIECGPKDICPLHERMRDQEVADQISLEGVDPFSAEGEEICRRVGEHGDWHDNEDPCGG